MLHILWIILNSIDISFGCLSYSVAMLELGSNSHQTTSTNGSIWTYLKFSCRLDEKKVKGKREQTPHCYDFFGKLG